MSENFIHDFLESHETREGDLLLSLLLLSLLLLPVETFN